MKSFNDLLAKLSPFRRAKIENRVSATIAELAEAEEWAEYARNEATCQRATLEMYGPRRMDSGANTAPAPRLNYARPD